METINNTITYSYEGNYTYDLNQYNKFMKSKRPIYKGCRNEACFCSGDCKEIIGYIDLDAYNKFIQNNIEPI